MTDTNGKISPRTLVPLGVVVGIIMSLVMLIFSLHERVPHRGSWTVEQQRLHEQVEEQARTDVRRRLDRLEDKVDRVLGRLPPAKDE